MLLAADVIKAGLSTYNIVQDETPLAFEKFFCHVISVPSLCNFSSFTCVFGASSQSGER